MNGGQSPFNRDRSELLALILERYGTRFNPSRQGNQKVRCINESSHPHGDRNPSASVNLGKGLYLCFACGLRGDGYSILKELEGWDVHRVNREMNVSQMKEEPEWI